MTNTLTKKDWDDLIHGLEVYSAWSHRLIMRESKSISMGFTAESTFPHILSACCARRAYEVKCPICQSDFPAWENYYEAKTTDAELSGRCSQGHVIKQSDMLIGKDITNEEFWASLQKKVSTKPLTKRK